MKSIFLVAVLSWTAIVARKLADCSCSTAGLVGSPVDKNRIRTGGFWFLAIAIVGLTGCCTRSHSPFRGLNHEEARSLAKRLTFACARELQADIRSTFAHHAPKNVLILSGGDAHGAFGCGVLNGWRNAPGGRPKFDVVTGISTGSLIATFAFLGEEQDDATLREVYTSIRDKNVYEGLRLSSSVFNTAHSRV
jgi:hypothetical protein